MIRQISIGIFSVLMLAIISLLFTKYYVTKFGKEEYALISIVLSVLSALFNLDALQKPLVSEFVIIRNQDGSLEKLIKLATTFSISIAVMAIVIFLVIGVYYEFKIAHKEYFFLYVSVCTYILLFFWSSPHKAYLIYTDRSYLNQIWKLITYGFFIFIAVLISFFWNSGPHIFLGLIVSGFIGVFFLKMQSRQPLTPSCNFGTSYARFSKIFIGGLTINLSVFFFLIIDKLFLRNESQLNQADYLIPYELVLKFSILHGIVGGVLLGKLSKNIRIEDGIVLGDYFKKCLVYIALVGVICSIIVIAGRPFFEIWLSGQTSNQMMLVYYILVLSFFFNSFGWLGFNVLLLTGKLRTAANIHVLLPIMLLIGCFFLSDSYGIIGIALSVAIARLVDVLMFVIPAVIFYKKKKS